jgi:hypothetical protein
MKRSKLIILAAFFLTANFIQAQEPKFKFGSVAAKDFEPTAYPSHSS